MLGEEKVGIARCVIEPELQLSILHLKALGKGLSHAGCDPAVSGFGFLNQLSFYPAHSFLPEASAGFFPLLAEFSFF
jgi:hypothetical protein